MYIERVPNRDSPPAVLLRESYREGKKVRKRTLANLSKLPDDVIDNLRAALKGGVAFKPEQIPDTFEIICSLPHGHVAAVFGTLKKLDLHNLIASESSRTRQLVLAMIVARIIDPRSKLATARGLNLQTCFSSLGDLLGVQTADENELYQAMDWLLARQDKIEAELAKRHLIEGSLVLYDLTSTYFEGETCPLANYGYSRDKKKGFLQIVFGLLCDQRGCPIAVEVFEGNTTDQKTLASQIDKVRSRFGISDVIWVGDRGMITEARIREDLKDRQGLDSITVLTKTQIQKLTQQKAIQLGLFDQRDLVELESADYPGERLIACRNPIVAASNQAKREALLQQTEKELEAIVAATKGKKRALRGRDTLGVRVGKILNKFKVGKFFDYEISDESFSYSRKIQAIAEAEALDGIYIVRTSVEEEILSATATVKAYKSLSQVEQAFRSYQTIDLKVRPIDDRLEDRVKAQVFLCMLAYYVEWHMREALAPILFYDQEMASALEEVVSVVAKAQRSKKGKSKATSKRTESKLPVHSFATLLEDLATITKNKIQSRLPGGNLIFEKITQPTPVQQKAFDLLSVSLICTH